MTQGLRRSSGPFRKLIGTFLGKAAPHLLNRESLSRIDSEPSRQLCRAELIKLASPTHSPFSINHSRSAPPARFGPIENGRTVGAQSAACLLLLVAVLVIGGAASIRRNLRSPALALRRANRAHQDAISTQRA